MDRPLRSHRTRRDDRDGIRQWREAPDLVAAVDLSAIGRIEVDAWLLRSASECRRWTEVQQGIAIDAGQHVEKGGRDLSTEFRQLRLSRIRHVEGGISRPFDRTSRSAQGIFDRANYRADARAGRMSSCVLTVAH